MKKILFIIIACSLISCGGKIKEDYKKELYAKREAEKEIKSEDLDREIAVLEAQAAKFPKSEEEKECERSEAQLKEMNSDKNFFFDEKFSNKDKYKKVKQFKLKLSEELSEVNGKYRLYLEAKKINAIGIVNYKVKFSPFSVSGDAVVAK